MGNSEVRLVSMKDAGNCHQPEGFAAYLAQSEDYAAEILNKLAEKQSFTNR